MRDLRHEPALAYPDLVDWIAYLAVDGKSEITQYSYTREIALLLRENPDTAFADFLPGQITATLALKPVRSRYITRSIFNGFFQWGEDQERIARNPMRGKVPRMKSPHRRPKDIFTDAEVAALEALPAPDGALLTLMFSAGLRRKECRNLQLRHIDLARGRLAVIEGKGGKDRVVPLPPETLQAVADLVLTEGLNPEDFLWYTRPGGRKPARRQPIANSTFDRWWRGDPPRRIEGVLERAGIRYLNPHQTRHTYGHRLREKGFTLEERKLLMGHDKIATTDYYYGTLTVEDVAARMAVAW